MTSSHTNNPMLTLYQIYHLFLQYTYLNGCLVLDNGMYTGILLKKDLEQKLNEKDHFFLDKVIYIPTKELEDTLFNTTPSLRMKIPYINTQGQISGLLLYDEFVSEFFPEDFSTKLSLTEIFNHFEHPLLITNQFKTILYQNNPCTELLSQEAFGKKMSDVLLSFNMSFDLDRMTLHRQDELWDLIISESLTNHAKYYIYQFIYKPLSIEQE